MKIELPSKRIPLHDRRLWILVACVTGVIIIAIAMVMRVSAKSDMIWTQVQHGNFTIELVESGEIRAVNSVFVKAPMEWRMELQIIDMAPEGSIVEEGDFLVQIDTSALEEELDNEIDKLKQAEAELKSIDTQQASRINELKTNIKTAGFIELTLCRYAIPLNSLYLFIHTSYLIGIYTLNLFRLNAK